MADMQDADWVSTTPDPAPFFVLWTCANIPQKSNNWVGANFRRWCDPRYDDLYNQSQRELDPEKRRVILIQMNEMLVEEVVTIPLMRWAQLSAVSNSITCYEPTPWDAETWRRK